MKGRNPVGVVKVGKEFLYDRDHARIAIQLSRDRIFIFDKYTHILCGITSPLTAGIWRDKRLSVSKNWWSGDDCIS